ncbi:MAG: hypothetical protein BMS9Abin22_644 [Gammaproteobacteria bacterium]|nr:MAG: hypothetical protein BMS9Abin22_644 [Gammaproteobacteria bacterium]
MRRHVQVALVIVMILYLFWGLALLAAPVTFQKILSTGPYDITTTAMFGAGLFAFIVIFAMTAHNPTYELRHAAAAGVTFFVFVAIYLMFISRTMPLNVWTVTSFIINLGAAVYILMSLTETTMKIGVTRTRRSGPKKKKKKSRRVKRRR